MSNSFFLNFWVYEREGNRSYQYFSWEDWSLFCTPSNECFETEWIFWAKYKESTYNGYSFYPDADFDDSLAFAYNKQIRVLKREHSYYNDYEMDANSLIDMNFDGELDYVIRYYGCRGTGLKNRIQVFYKNEKIWKFE